MKIEGQDLVLTPPNKVNPDNGIVAVATKLATKELHIQRTELAIPPLIRAYACGIDYANKEVARQANAAVGPGIPENHYDGSRNLRTVTQIIALMDGTRKGYRTNDIAAYLAYKGARTAQGTIPNYRQMQQRVVAIRGIVKRNSDVIITQDSLLAELNELPSDCVPAINRLAALSNESRELVEAAVDEMYTQAVVDTVVYFLDGLPGLMEHHGTKLAMLVDDGFAKFVRDNPQIDASTYRKRNPDVYPQEANV